jgi:acetyltransferase-like isoleucine patch superfamily enzyme
MASMASNAKLIAVESVILGDFARFGSESQIMDTNFHQMIDTTTGERYKVTQPVVIGSYNYIGNKVSVMPEAAHEKRHKDTDNSSCHGMHKHPV